MVIEKVLKITKAPTNTAMPPKASSTFWMTATCLSVWLDSACTWAGPVTTSAPAGTIDCSCSTSISWVTPSAAATKISSS